MLDNFRVRLKVEDTGYRVNPRVHESRLKPRALFPRRPTVEIDEPEDDEFRASCFLKTAGHQTLRMTSMK
ncbi:hypothetical protein V7S43_011202 [Phytophthora oleae]|uniref:Uncharacterized protein n=1 Tax=Phytophthora oleae TaxID=2107226 RepID=A0ABD3FAI2_9STRA